MRNSQPFFSIGVTTYNRQAFLEETLKSLLEQSYQNYEIIIGNDCVEKPLTEKLLGLHDKRLRIINHKKNLGELGNMNSLLKLAKGRYFIWIFDDDPCSPSLLRIAEKNIRKFNYPLAVYPSFKHVYGSKEVIFRSPKNEIGFLIPGKKFVNSYFLKKIKILGCCGFYNTKYLKKIGGVQKLSESKFALHSEYLLIIKSALLKKIAYIPEPLLVTRSHCGSWSTNNKDLRYFMQAGYRLIEEAFGIFSHQTLAKDIVINMRVVIKFILASVVVKIIETHNHFSNKEYLFFTRNIKKIILGNKTTKKSFEVAQIIDDFNKIIIFYKIKAYIKNIVTSHKYDKLKTILKS